MQIVFDKEKKRALVIAALIILAVYAVKGHGPGGPVSSQNLFMQNLRATGGLENYYNNTLPLLQRSLWPADYQKVRRLLEQDGSPQAQAMVVQILQQYAVDKQTMGNINNGLQCIYARGHNVGLGSACIP